MANRNSKDYLARDVVRWLARVLPINYPEVMIRARLKQERSGVYHEHQRQHHDVCTGVCILHALNNLLQGERAFTRRELAGIAARTKFLSRFSYDVRFEDVVWRARLFLLVLYMMQKRQRSFHSFIVYSTTLFHAALGRRNKMVDCYDRELVQQLFGLAQPLARGQLPRIASYRDKLVGILLISQQPVSKERHWVAMRKVGRDWYNLDSLLPEPYILPNGEEDLELQMACALDNAGSVLIVWESP